MSSETEQTDSFSEEEICLSPESLSRPVREYENMKRVTYEDIFQQDTRCRNERYMCWHYDTKIINTKKMFVDMQNYADGGDSIVEFESDDGFSSIDVFVNCLRAISKTVGGEDMSLSGFMYNDDGIVEPSTDS